MNVNNLLDTGHRKGRSLLIEDGALTWLISNCNTAASAATRRHIELALCHLAQNGNFTFRKGPRISSPLHKVELIFNQESWTICSKRINNLWISEFVNTISNGPK